MASKYAAQFKKYEEESSQQFSGANGALNFVSVTKKEPKVYMQLLSESLFPVPMHMFTPLPNGKKASFVCRSFIGERCPVCDAHLTDSYGKEARPRRQYIGIVAVYEKEGQGRFRVKRADVKVSKEKAQQVTEKWPQLKPVEESQFNVTFPDTPVVGLFQGGRTVDEQLGAIVAEFGDGIHDAMLAVSRSGEGLKTTYNVMNLGSSPLAHDNEMLEQAVDLHMTVDEFIDEYISMERYDRLFLGKNERETPADPWKDASTPQAAGAKADDAKVEEEIEEDIDAIIAAKYSGASK